MKWLVWAVILILVPSVLAQDGTIKLLALNERSDGDTRGMVADLDLEIESGQNRVFLETFPLTKIATQLSMRFAQQIACNELDIDCSRKDFFFTVRALPGIVGGPSAGSAAAVLTASMISGLELRKDTGITGTINSGGVIGPVGGIKYKIEAAADAGLKRVLIPRGTRSYNDTAINMTVDLIEYGSDLGLEVIEVTTLQEALTEYTGEKFPALETELEIEPRYLEVMKQISLDLCDRTEQIFSLLEEKRKNIHNTTDLESEAANMSARAKIAFDEEQYYASASYCFRSNVQYKKALALQRNWTDAQIARAVITLRKKAINYSDITDKQDVRTITDLQTFMAVKERLFDTEEILFDIIDDLNDTKTNAERIAYAEERLFSAATWSRFFNGGERKYQIDEASLRDSCIAKIGESEERINYVRSLLPKSLKDARRDLDKAYQDLSNGNYTLCLYKASKSKADADVILGLVGVNKEDLDELIELKLAIVKDAVIKSQKQGIFPIIGYSYYEYSDSLKEFDQTSAMLFAEYALEFSNLDLYFPKKTQKGIRIWEIISPHFSWLLSGFIVGVLITFALFSVSGRKKYIRRKRK